MYIRPLAGAMVLMATIASGYALAAPRTLDAGGIHACAIVAGGEVRCWGDDNLGQLGDGRGVSGLAPVRVEGLPGPAIAVAAGNEHTCALLASGEVWCWGDNEAGQLGVGDFDSHAAPVRVRNLVGPIADIAAGGGDTCAVMASGALACWGDNGHGQLGAGSLIDSARPVNPIGLAQGVSQVALSGLHACAVLLDGSVQCWGYDVFGQAADATLVDQVAPVVVKGIDHATQVTAAGWRSCALTADRDVRCWGAVQSSVSGGPLQTSVTPVPIELGSTRPAALSDGGDTLCVIDALSGAQCWGDNEVGQLGDGTHTTRAVPTPVTGLSAGVRVIAAAFEWTCAQLQTGDVECWGANWAGQQGSADRANHDVPTPALLDYVLVPTAVVEYYDAVLDHYFMTLLPGEIAALDGGRFPGWVRTGLSFKAWPLATTDTSPVCRFYLPPSAGDSHFYSASPAECADVRARFPTFVEESQDVMHAVLPDLASGTCPPDTDPVFRLWNQRVDTNHRYTTDLQVRATMIARGYVSEGYGPAGTAFCAPR